MVAARRKNDGGALFFQGTEPIAENEVDALPVSGQRGVEFLDAGFLRYLGTPEVSR